MFCTSAHENLQKSTHRTPTLSPHTGLTPLTPLKPYPIFSSLSHAFPPRRPPPPTTQLSRSWPPGAARCWLEATESWTPPATSSGLAPGGRQRAIRCVEMEAPHSCRRRFLALIASHCIGLHARLTEVLGSCVARQGPHQRHAAPPCIVLLQIEVSTIQANWAWIRAL
jgi:hypothetical protein